PEPIHVPEIWSMRARRFEPVSAYGHLRGRYGVCAVNPDRKRESPRGGVSDEHRRGDSGQAKYRLLDHLWIGHREPEPTRVCCFAGFPLDSIQRLATVGCRISAGQLSRYRPTLEG